MNQSLYYQILAEAERKAAARLEEFRSLRARGTLCTEVTEQYATEAAANFLDQFHRSGEYLSDAIALLAEIAALEEPCLSEPGQRATFPLLIERLSDSFDPELCDLYDRVFTQMISYCRVLPAGARLNAALNDFGLHTEDDLLARRARLRRRPPWRDQEEQRAVRKVLVLSRVTLGAEVAITSVVLQRARSLFPEARCVLLAPPKARELFGGDASLEIREVSYRSGGRLLERLESWLALAEAVEEGVGSLPPREYVLLDPDSRFLQLGMLPVLRDESRYFFFESRRAGSGGSKTLSRLTAEWLNETFGGNALPSPNVSIRPQDREFGLRIRRRLGDGGARWIITMSFGVGGNSEKRLPDPFEEQLIVRLIEEGATIVLDQGAGDEERERARRLVDAMRQRGGSVADIEVSNVGASAENNSPLRCALLTWQGGIGAWAGLIGASDEYIGYDSAGQHIAAALGIPTIDIFVPCAAERFRQRWQPAGEGMVRVVAEGDRNQGAESHGVALDKVIAAHREIRNTKGR
ncbi:MAG: hypothetical protein HY316_06650 [Acidobacteria bacterium]|nr:hypothetical protein [Acidobacteriota bacterium]